MVRHENHSTQKQWLPSNVQDAKNYYNKELKSKVRFGESTRHNVNRQAVVLPKWENDVIKSPPPKDLTVTSIRQSFKLHNAHEIEIVRSDDQSSDEWLKLHGIEAEGLTLKKLLKDYESLSNVSSKENGVENLQISNVDLEAFESKLHHILNVVQERVKWLQSDSRKIFGLIKGKSPAILFDASDGNVAFQRLDALQDSLKLLVKDQICFKNKFIMASYGTATTLSWNLPRNVNNLSLKEAEFWIDSIVPSGGCNLLQAFKQILKQKEIDSIVIILGGRPDQHPDTLIDYFAENLSGREISIQTVAYQCGLLDTRIFLEELSARTNGRHHCYSDDDESQVMSGKDLVQLLNETQRIKHELSQLQEIKKSKNIHEKVVSCINQPGYAFIEAGYAFPEASFRQRQQDILHRIDADFDKLTVEKPTIPVRTSKEWLKSYGLKAKCLTLYQVMAPNAYSYVTSYVSTINKQIESKIYHQSMVQMDWYDGSVKNVHVDPVILYNYQHHLKASLDLYKRRLQWLSEDSRQKVGTIVEKRVIIVIDMSQESQYMFGNLHVSIKTLLQEQLSNQTLFNLICIGEKVSSFSDVMVETNEDNLSACWKWLTLQEFTGTRRFLPSLRFILENEKERKNGIDVDGIYIISTGYPKEQQDIVCSYINEATIGTNTTLNIVFYQASSEMFQSSTEHSSNYLRSLTQHNKGRFHWYDTHAIVESDDIKLISEEMNKASNYLKKSELLLSKMKIKQEERDMARAMESKRLESSRMNYFTSNNILPKSAQLVCQRPKSAVVYARTTKKTKRRPVSAKLKPKKVAWRPTSAQSGSLIPSVAAPIPGKNFKDVNERVVFEDDKPTQQIFYTEIGNSIGGVMKSNDLTRKKKPRTWTNFKIPENEELVSSKDWLHRYGLSRLKLDLVSIVSSSKCGHSSDVVPSLKKSVPARYCDIFPSIELNGVTHHLHLQSNELSKYESLVEVALRRYLKRMKWMLQGSRSIFGTVLEKTVIILIDISGSMIDYLEELKEKLKSLIWEQLHKAKRSFNLICYSSEVRVWQETVVEATVENCEQALEWLNQIMVCSGETATLEALQAAFGYQVNAFYLLTDGKPDCSTTMVLREAANMNMNQCIRIHTISFNCNDSAANKFLQILALQSKGRYHRFISAREYDDSAIITLTNTENTSEMFDETVCFEGDDLRLLLKEINLARKYLMQSKSWRSLLDSQQKKPEHVYAKGTPLKKETVAAR